MAAPLLTLQGVGGALAYLTQLRSAVGQFTGVVTTVGSDLPYASPMNYGVYFTGRRAGQIARKAGPALFLEQGLATAQPQLAPLVAAALESGDVAGARQHAGDVLVNAVRPFVPVRSGALQASIRSTPGGR